MPSPPLTQQSGPATTSTRAQAPSPKLDYATVRDQTKQLCADLEVEDHVIQSMPDASPAKWHLAHTTWFFETFLLADPPGWSGPGYRSFDASFRTVFNSYYNQVGEQFTRDKRGTLARPTVKTVHAYRRHVDNAMLELIEGGLSTAEEGHLQLGLHHEQQHQELLLTDLKHGLGQWACPGFPLDRPYSSISLPKAQPPKEGFVAVAGGVFSVGHSPDAGFAFDSETPRHQVLLSPFKIARDVVRNKDFLEFIADGGYDRADLWLSDGWSWRQESKTTCPLYWWSDGETRQSGTAQDWQIFTLHGLAPMDANAPLVHVSFFEADAFARWKGARLPTEQEWEVAMTTCPTANGAFLESSHFHPVGALASVDDQSVLSGAFGDVWEWTASPYVPYPKFAPLPGALGEYNGKFMNGQRVLRGGSIATPQAHLRATYRNFFQPEKRWQFSGIRLAKDGG